MNNVIEETLKKLRTILSISDVEIHTVDKAQEYTHRLSAQIHTVSGIKHISMGVNLDQLDADDLYEVVLGQVGVIHRVCERIKGVEK